MEEPSIRLKKEFLELGLIILVIVMFFVAGMYWGYNKGYTYVKDYNEKYIENYCVCHIPEKQYDVGYGINISSFLENEKNKIKK